MSVRPPAPQSATELEPLLRRRLVLVAALAAITATFFSTFRRTSPVEINFYLQTTHGTVLLIFEAVFGGLALALAGTDVVRAAMVLARAAEDHRARHHRVLLHLHRVDAIVCVGRESLWLHSR